MYVRIFILAAVGIFLWKHDFDNFCISVESLCIRPFEFNSDSEIHYRL